MRHAGIILSFIGFLLFSACATHHTTTTYWNRPGKIRKAEGTAYFKTDKEGKKIEIRDGLWITWHKNTQKNTEMHFKDGVLTGEMKVWYPNGKLKYKANYDIKGLLDGEILFYTPAGKVKSYHMKHGTGIICSYYDDGTMKSELSYENGILHGKAKFFDEEGRLEREEIYLHGKKQSLSGSK